MVAWGGKPCTRPIPLPPPCYTHYTHYIGPTIPTIPTFPRLTRPPAVLVTPQFLSPIPGSLFSYTRLTIPTIALNHPTAESVMPIPFRVLPYDCCAYHVKPIHVWSELGGNLSFYKVQTTCIYICLNCPDGTHSLTEYCPRTGQVLVQFSSVFLEEERFESKMEEEDSCPTCLWYVTKVRW